MSSFKVARWCALSCVVACNNPSSVPVDSPPDTPVEDPPVEQIVFVELFGSSPVFVRYRTGGGEWREPVDTGDGYEMTVVDDYELVAACATDVAADVGFIAGTVDEGLSTYIPCYPPFSDAATTAAVTGTMKQPGRVFLNREASGETPNWTFDLELSIGTKDLIALDDTRVAVRRDLEVLGPTTIAQVDLATEGVDLIDTAFSVDASPGEQLASSLWWFTANTGTFISLGSATTLGLPPPSVVGQFDTQYVAFDAFGKASYRSVFIQQFRGAPTSVELLPQLEGVEFNTDGVTWSGTLPGDDADLYTYGGANSIHVNASAGWLAGRHKLAIDTDIPGFNPAWKITSTDYRSFSVNDSSPYVFRSSGVDDQTP